jgi:hypothetical protein
VLYFAAISRSYLKCFDDPHQPMLEGVEMTRVDAPARDCEAFLGAIAGVLRLDDLLCRRSDGEHLASTDISPPPPSPHQNKSASNDNTCNTSDDDDSDPDANGGHVASGTFSQ